MSGINEFVYDPSALSAREQIRAKPGSVQVVLKARMVKLSEGSTLDSNEEMERYGLAALKWWAETVARFQALLRSEAGVPSETVIAEQLVQAIRSSTVWGNILRGNSQ